MSVLYKLLILVIFITFTSACSDIYQRFIYKNTYIVATGDVPVYEAWSTNIIDGKVKPDFTLTKGQEAQVIRFDAKSYPIRTVKTISGKKGQIECGNYNVMDRTNNQIIWVAYPCRHQH